MKKILLLSLLSLFTLSANYAQDLIKTDEDNTYAVVESETYNQFLDNYLRVQFRSFAYEVLHLDESEIKATDPILMEYLKAKNDLYDQRQALVNHLQREATNSPSDTLSEGDFLKAYWEISISEQNLRKDYFNQLRQVIPFGKAFQFFLLEESLQGKAQEDQISSWLADVPQWNQAKQMYNQTLARYNRWMHNFDGGVSVTHDYTYDGLEKLTQTIEAIVIVNHLDIEGLYRRTSQVMQWAENLQSPDNVEQHALLVRKAFIEVAQLIKDIADYPGLDFIELANEDLLRTAKQIDPEILYIEQAPYAYIFFQRAQQVLNDISM